MMRMTSSIGPFVLRDHFRNPQDDAIRWNVTSVAAAIALVATLASFAVELSRSETRAALEALLLAAGFATALALLLLAKRQQLAANLLTLVLVVHVGSAVLVHGGNHPSLLVSGVVPVVAILCAASPWAQPGACSCSRCCSSARSA